MITIYNLYCWNEARALLLHVCWYVPELVNFLTEVVTRQQRCMRNVLTLYMC